MQKQKLITLKVDQVRLRDRVVRPSKSDVTKMAKSIAEIGLIQPPIVNSKNILIVGFSRYLAVCQLGHKTIDCIQTVGLSNKAAERLMEIDENLTRRQFSAAQMARQLKERRIVWEEIHGKVKPGRPKKGEGPGFGVETAEQTGLSLSTIRRVTKISNSLGRTTLEALDEVPIGQNQKSLLRIAAIDDEHLRKQTVIYAIKSKAKDWRELSHYIRKLLRSDTPAARARWESVVGEILLTPAEAQDLAVLNGHAVPASDGDIYDGSTEAGERAAGYTALQVILELGPEVLPHIEGVSVVEWDAVKSIICRSWEIQKAQREPISTSPGEDGASAGAVS